MNEIAPELPDDPRLARLAAVESLVTHPSGSALASFDEDPAALSAGTRSWIANHLEECAACRSALRSVPRLGLPRRTNLARPWPLVAAAGWILAAFLAWRVAAPRNEFPLATVHTLVLSTVRGDGRASIPAEATILRCELVLGEDVALGDPLRVRLVDVAGRTLFDAEQRVEERNEREWPVLTLDRRALPAGNVRLHVRTPSGLESVFELEL